MYAGCNTYVTMCDEQACNSLPLSVSTHCLHGPHLSIPHSPLVSTQLTCLLAGWLVASASAEEPAARWSFINDVIPALTKAGCNRGACHAAQVGKGGFKLSLRGSDPAADYRAIARDGSGRRLDLLRPDESLLLLKPTMRVPHRGGHALKRNSETWRILRDWVAQHAAGPDDADPQITQLQFVSSSEALSLERGQRQPLAIEATYTDGSRRDVTRWCRFDTNDSTVASADHQGVVTAVGKGKAAISVNFQGKFIAAIVEVPYGSATNDYSYTQLSRRNYIDEIVIRQWQRLRLWPSPQAGDATFLRRVYLDVSGTLPSPERVRRFLADPNPGKRDALIYELLESPEFVDLWVTKLGDIFRTSSEWLGGEGILPFNQYLRESLSSNVPFDTFVHALVSGAGDAAQNGPANYVRLYRAGGTQNWHLNISETVAQTFLGYRIQCARCHDHPKDRWTQDDYYGLGSFFSRVRASRPAGKSDGPETLIADHGLHEVPHPRRGIVLPRTLDGVELKQTPARRTLWETSQWIWDAPDAAKQAEVKTPRYFRRVLQLTASPLAAQIYSAADDQMTLHVNGQSLGAGGTHTAIKRHDLTPLLHKGKNVIAVETVNNAGPGGLLAWIEIVQADQSSTLLGTDASWKVSKTLQDQWTITEFNDSTWVAATIQGAPTMEPWKLQPQPAQPIAPNYASRRTLFADWLTSPDNRQFALMTANRVWRHLMGRGIVEPVDDFRLTNPPTDQQLLDALADDLVKNRFALRHLMRTILTSNTYQLSAVPTVDNRLDTMFYSRYYPRRMTAEQILDAICQVSGIAEEFPGQPAGTRAQQLPDTKVASAFLDAFGRPLRRSASCECERIQDPNLGQALELLNGTELHERVISDAGLVNRLIQQQLDDRTMLETLYLSALNRLPGTREIEAVLAGVPANDATLRRHYFEDLLWALFNGKEFLFNH